MKRPTWIALHAELEMDHFLDAIRPALMHWGANVGAIGDLTRAIEGAIDRHVQYFEAMLSEYQAERSSRGGT